MSRARIIKRSFECRRPGAGTQVRSNNFTLSRAAALHRKEATAAAVAITSRTGDRMSDLLLDGVSALCLLFTATK